MNKIISIIFSLFLFISIIFADISVTPYGAAETVSGSCFLLETEGCKVIVDCGLFMRSEVDDDSISSSKRVELKNQQIQTNLINANALFLTHAHLDHSGRIPLLIHSGFQGKIYSTQATKELALTLFKERNGFDLIKRKWFWSASRRKKAKGKNNFVLAHWSGECKENIKSIEYSNDEILLEDLKKKENVKFLLCKNCCETETKKIEEQFVAVGYNEDINIADALKVKFINAAHILGSASLIFQSNNKKVLFSGDLGSGYSRFSGEFDIPESVDLIFMEATHGGDKNKNIAEQYELFRKDLKLALDNKKTVWIPVLSFNKTQKVLYELKLMQDERKLSKKIPIYSISPGANTITSLYQKEILTKNYGDWFLSDVYKNGSILPAEVKLQMIRNYDKQMILLSASGDMDKGKSEQLIPQMLTRKDVFVMIVNYVNPESNAGLILKGERTHSGIKSIAKIKKYSVFSDHADFDMLQKWLSKQNKNVAIYIIHSSAGHSQDMLNLLQKEGWQNVNKAEIEKTVV
ncbi:MAG: MBL fold metallo-hydrolase [Endomicrobium sp.]|uniref:MBL fold metallo-hydrolase n=1 Tax=Candidatus Endomicrobiellum pyrsonymphae TaxID=1408203 RepID=UPI00357B221B|nr:MBL fold metallo-hydrolase [Endomicrobium sp.]